MNTTPYARYGLTQVVNCGICRTLDTWFLGMYRNFFGVFTLPDYVNSVPRRFEAMCATTPHLLSDVSAPPRWAQCPLSAARGPFERGYWGGPQR